MAKSLRRTAVERLSASVILVADASSTWAWALSSRCQAGGTRVFWVNHIEVLPYVIARSWFSAAIVEARQLPHHSHRLLMRCRVASPHIPLIVCDTDRSRAGMIETLRPTVAQLVAYPATSTDVLDALLALRN
jgi:hypothetical protein